MHADLVKLLDLQSKDAVVEEIERRMGALRAESAALDQALERAREGRDAAHRAAADGARKRDELESKIESYRLLQERRQLRLEHVRNPKEASTLMAELDLARSVQAKEETDWVRSAEGVTQLEEKAKEADRGFTAFEESQAPERSQLAGRQAELAAERCGRGPRPGTERVPARSAASHSIRAAPKVPVGGRRGAAGSAERAAPAGPRCPSIGAPRSARARCSTSCEACGAILYPPEVVGSSS